MRWWVWFAVACTGSDGSTTPMSTPAPAPAPAPTSTPYEPCSTPIDELEDILGELGGWNPLDVALSIVDGALDPDCLEDCVAEGWDVCREATACPTASGAVLTYRRVEREQSTIDPYLSSRREFSEERVELDFPEGNVLRSLMVDWQRFATDVDGVESSSAETAEATIEWEGRLDDVQLESAVASQRNDRLDDTTGRPDRNVYEIDGCETRFDEDLLLRGGQEVRVRRGDVWLDYVECLGRIDGTQPCAEPNTPPEVPFY